MSKNRGVLVVREDTIIQGEIRRCHQIEIYGYVEGQLAADNLLVHQGGQCYGIVQTDTAEIHGTVQGDVFVKHLINIRSSGSVSGNVQYGQLAMEPGGNLSADVRNVPPTLSGDLDLTFGRPGWGGHRLPVGLDHALVQLSPIGIMAPAGHALASQDEVRVAELARVPVVMFAAREAGEWQDWQEQLAKDFGLRLSGVVHGHGLSAAEGAVLSHGPILCAMNVQPLDGIVVRPLVDPVPICPWSVIWRAKRRDPRIEQAVALISEIAARREWLVLPEGPWWVPEGDLARTDATRPAPPQFSSGMTAVSARVKLHEAGFLGVVDQFGSGAVTELLLDPGAVGFDRAEADAAEAGDFGVGVTEGEQAQDLLLLGREGEGRVPGPLPTGQLDAE